MTDLTSILQANRTSTPNKDGVTGNVTTPPSNAVTIMAVSGEPGSRACKEWTPQLFLETMDRIVERFKEPARLPLIDEASRAKIRPILEKTMYYLKAYVTLMQPNADLVKAYKENKIDSTELFAKRQPVDDDQLNSLTENLLERIDVLLGTIKIIPHDDVNRSELDQIEVKLKSMDLTILWTSGSLIAFKKAQRVEDLSARINAIMHIRHQERRAFRVMAEHLHRIFHELLFSFYWLVDAFDM
jgi:hypothetical protein